VVINVFFRVRKDMITIYDALTDTEITARNKSDMAKILGIGAEKVSRLMTNFNISMDKRYIKSKEECFILEEIESGKEYICATKTNFFQHLNQPYEENISKYIYEVLSGRQKTFSYQGLVFRIKKFPKINPRRKVLFEKGFNKITCPLKKKSNLIQRRVRCRLWGALNSQSKKKNKKTFEYIGCSIEFLMGWIENQFVDGMSWERIKEIHIDHIKPCNLFDFNNENEIYECFHYTNLRPLWARENLSRPKDGSDIKDE
jgi:hypothetical protein